MLQTPDNIWTTYVIKKFLTKTEMDRYFTSMDLHTRTHSCTPIRKVRVIRAYTYTSQSYTSTCMLFKFTQMRTRTHMYLWRLLSSKIGVLLNGQTLDSFSVRSGTGQSATSDWRKTIRGITINREKVKLLFAGDTLHLENSESQKQNQLNERILLDDRI